MPKVTPVVAVKLAGRELVVAMEDADTAVAREAQRVALAQAEAIAAEIRAAVRVQVAEDLQAALRAVIREELRDLLAYHREAQ